MSKISSDIFDVVKQYNQLGLTCTDLRPDPEGQEYSACSCLMKGKKTYFRCAKITPKKTGQFVTFWQRSAPLNPIAPFDMSDDFERLIVIVRKSENVGQFIFPKYILSNEKILSKNKQGGKRAFRVYAPWDKVESKQAIQAQCWQQAFFVESLIAPEVNSKTLELIGQ